MQFKALDIFSVPVNLFIAGERSIKTNIGGIFSASSLVMIVIFSWFIGNDIIYREKPFSYQQTNVFGAYPSITLNSTSFPLAFSLQNFYGQQVVTDTYFEFSLQTVVLEADQNGVLQQTGSVSYHMNNCTYSDFPLMGRKTFDTLGLSNFICPQSYNVTLQGYWTEKLLIFLQFNVHMCDFVNNSTCHSKEEIENYISANQVSMNVYMYTPELVISNFSKPITNLPINKFSYLTPKNNKYIQFFVSQDDILTDDGFLTQSLNDLEFLTVKNQITDSMIYDTEVNCLMQYEFYSNNTSTQTFRKYIKVTEILASVGGIIKILYMIYQFLNNRFAEVEAFKIINNNLKSFAKPFKTASSRIKTSPTPAPPGLPGLPGLSVKEFYSENILNQKERDMRRGSLACSEKDKSNCISPIKNRNISLIRKNSINFKTSSIRIIVNDGSPKNPKFSEIRKEIEEKFFNFSTKRDKMIRLTFCQKFSIVILHKVCLLRRSRDKNIQFYLNQEKKLKNQLDLVNIVRMFEENKLN